MPDNLLIIARVAGAFGVKGEIRITTFTEDPLALKGYRNLLRQDGTPGLRLTTVRAVKGAVIARAEGVETRDQAELLRGLNLHIDRAALPPPEEDEFYLADLIGLAVEAPDGTSLGTIKAVQDFGAGDLLEIQPPRGASWWLPFTKATVPEVRIGEGRLIARKPDEIE